MDRIPEVGELVRVTNQVPNHVWAGVVCEIIEPEEKPELDCRGKALPWVPTSIPNVTLPSYVWESCDATSNMEIWYLEPLGMTIQDLTEEAREELDTLLDINHWNPKPDVAEAIKEIESWLSLK